MLQAFTNIFRGSLFGPGEGGAATGPGEAPGPAETSPSTDGRVSIPGVEMLPDDELERLNTLLPWAAFVLDAQGRRFGAAYSSNKRNVPQAVPDARIVELDRRLPLTQRTVLEIGCFEGIHTAALAARAARVLACDSRIENVVKTIVRCAMFGVPAPLVFRWDAEAAPPASVDLRCDVLHHVGVLYHLTDPVGHLTTLAPLVRDCIMLDTQVAPENGRAQQYQSGGRNWRYVNYREAGREAPFAGMRDHAKWMFRSDLVALLRELGFNDIQEASLSQQRHGPRWLVYARR